MDDKGQSFSIQFGDDRQSADFAAHIALVKSYTDPRSLLTIDIKPGSGNVRNAGETVGVRVIGWVEENGKRGGEFLNRPEQDLLKLNLGSNSSAYKGLDEGCVGMRKGGRRIIIVPPSAY